jgi:hypothetical protein
MLQGKRITTANQGVKPGSLGVQSSMFNVRRPHVSTLNLELETLNGAEGATLDLELSSIKGTALT